MNLTLEDIGKRFNTEWIFRHLNYSFTAGNSYAILGPNGSGKSTLLQVLAGYVTPSEGQFVAQSDNGNIPIEEFFRHISIAAPYLDLFEEMTLLEAAEFHHRFKPFFEGIAPHQIPGLSQLEGSEKKYLKHYSSGMKQRVKLAFAILSKTPVLLLDEPTSNLDTNGTMWFQQLLEKHSQNRLVVISSNSIEAEIKSCNHQLSITDFKN